MKGQSFKEISGGFDPAPLLARLTDEMWEAEERRQSYPGSAHAEAQSIFIRWAKIEEGDDPIAESFQSLDIVDYPHLSVLMPEIGAALMETLILISLGGLPRLGVMGKVMLTRLPPGAHILRHSDEGLYADIYDRFHLCLQGEGTFECGGKLLRPKPGDIFWFNHKRLHCVRNDGATDRIHLIVDVKAPEYTRLRGITFQTEKVSDLWDEVMPLLERNRQEIAHYQDIPLGPDIEAYAAVEKAGRLRCYTARDVRTLIGYLVFSVGPNLHYKSSLQATQDVLFLAPEYRKGGSGLGLIQHDERALTAEGVQVILQHVKLTNQVGKLLATMGYERIEEIYAKRLGE